MLLVPSAGEDVEQVLQSVHVCDNSNATIMPTATWSCPFLVNQTLALALMDESGEALRPPHAGEVFGHPILDIYVSPSPTNSLSLHVTGTTFHQE